VPKVHLPYAAGSVSLSIDADRLLGVFGTPEAEGIDDLAEAAREALAHPIGVPSLDQASVPGDRVVIVVDEPQRRTPTEPMVAAIVESLVRGGVQPQNVTLLVSRASQAWVPGGDLAGLAGVFDGQIQLEVHDPTEPTRLAYLTTTRDGHRAYLNRTLVDADLVILCGQVGLDPVTGFGGGPASLMPGLSDTDSWQRYGLLAHRGGADASLFLDPSAQDDAQDISQLLGVLYAVQVVMGPDEDAIGIWAGLPADAFGQATAFYRRQWFGQLARPADLVIAGVDGRRTPPTLSDALPVLNYVRQAVADGGRIALVSSCPEGDGLGRWAETLARSEQPAEVRRQLRDRHGPIEMGLMQLLATVARGDLYLLSGLDADSVDEWFMTALTDPTMLQHLADAADSVAVIPHATQSLVWVS